MANKIILKRGLDANISSANLADGEVALATDSNKLYTKFGEIAPDSVYVGTDEPSSSSVELWIKPDGVSDITDLQNKYLQLEARLNSYWEAIYPVGSTYISVNSTSPHDLFGGTWEQIQGRVLVGCGSNGVDLDTIAGQTGGEAFHTLTVDEMPNHKHGLDYYINYNLEGGYDKLLAFGSTTAEGYNNDYFMNFTGGGKAHNNMPPYLSVYMWRRTE